MFSAFVLNCGFARRLSRALFASIGVSYLPSERLVSGSTTEKGFGEDPAAL
jgi:hypothetical protein